MKGWIIWLVLFTFLVVYNTVKIAKWMDEAKADKMARVYVQKIGGLK